MGLFFATGTLSLLGAQSGAAATAQPAKAGVSSAPAMLTADAAKLAKDPAQALALYWTPERMRAAIPADAVVRPGTPETAQTTFQAPARIDGSAGKGGAAGATPADVAQGQPWGTRGDTVASTNGKVYFTGSDGLGYACSGAIVNSEAKNTVFTAGHCVHDGGGGNWFTNWTFVPDYSNGDRPHGTWSARQLWSLDGWIKNSDRGYDIGAVVMFNDSSGNRIANLLGGQGIWWNGPRDHFVYHFGYPANSPFDGERLIYCDGTPSGSGNLELNCTMQGGASGGPWVRDFNGSWGYEISVNSYHVGNDLTKIYGPFFGDGAANLYNAVRNLT